MFRGRHRIERILLGFTKMRDNLLLAIEDCKKERQEKVKDLEYTQFEISSIDVSITQATKAIHGLEHIV